MNHVRGFFLIRTTVSALGCAKPARPVDIGIQGFRATVFADSAIFLYPTPTRSVWKWNVLDDRGFGAEQFMWQAIWDVSRNPPYSLGQGFGVGVVMEKKAEPRSGSIGDVLRASTGRALIPPPKGLDVAFAVYPEDSLFIAEHGGTVRVTLRRSPTLARLLKSRPDSVRLEVRLPLIEFRAERVVGVQYRANR